MGVNGKMLSCVLSRSCVSDVNLCVGRLRCVLRVHSCLPVLEGEEFVTTDISEEPTVTALFLWVS